MGFFEDLSGTLKDINGIVTGVAGTIGSVNQITKAGGSVSVIPSVQITASGSGTPTKYLGFTPIELGGLALAAAGGYYLLRGKKRVGR